MALFVHEAEKYTKSDNKLTEEQFKKYEELSDQRNSAWNAKAQEIAIRSLKKIAFDRASTAHQNGEKEAKELYESYYEFIERKKVIIELFKSSQETFAGTWTSLSNADKKQLQKFKKKVNEFHTKVEEQYKFEEPEESESEHDKKFNQAFSSFEGMD